MRELEGLSFFEDDAVFQVTVELAGIPLIRKVRAPSRVILERKLFQLFPTDDKEIKISISPPG